MDRRTFIGSLVGGFAAAPRALGAQAQKAGKVWRIGFLRIGEQPINAAFGNAMRQLAWVQGQNITLE